METAKYFEDIRVICKYFHSFVSSKNYILDFQLDTNNIGVSGCLCN